jgi:hypothetical protein
MQINWVLLTYFVISVFALSGFFRGWWKEGVTTGGLAFLFVLLNNSPMAAELINFTNSVVAAVWSLSPETFYSLFQDVLAIEISAGRIFQLDASSPNTWIWLLMFMVVFTTVLGRSAGPSTDARSIARFLGGLLGGFNGFLFISLLREYLDGRFLPGDGLSTSQAGNIATNGVAIQATNLPAYTVMDSLMPWIIIIVCLLIFLTALNSRVGLPKNKVRFWELDYRKPYGYN